MCSSDLGTNGCSRPGSSTSSNTSRRKLPSASSQSRTAWPASAGPGREPPADSPAASATAASPASRVSLFRALIHAMSRQLSLTRSPDARQHDRRLLASPVQLRQQGGPGLQTRRRGRDIPDNELFICCRQRRRFHGIRLPGAGRRLNDRRIQCQVLTKITGSAPLTAVISRLWTSTYPPQRG